jgi:predicted RNase H-like HicB family nuclease
MEADTVTVVYHYEDGLWWAESPDVPEFSGGGNTFQEARERAREGLAFALNRRIVSLDERLDDAARAARQRAISVQVYGMNIYASPTTFASVGSEPARTAVAASAQPLKQGVATSAAWKFTSSSPTLLR